MATSFADRVKDTVGPQLAAYTWYRYSLIQPFLIPGPMRVLNIGTGGGFETLRLLKMGNQVTTIEIDQETADRTRRRVERNGFGDRHVGLVGHVIEIDPDETFQMVLMTEVLEHVMHDLATLRRISNWLLPSGRLVLSTPTSSYGYLPGDTCTPVEDGGHVRVGYDGPELDLMLRSVGLITTRRVFNASLPVQWQYRLERKLQANPVTRPFAPAYSLASRLVLPLLDLVPYRYYNQITLAAKTEV